MHNHELRMLQINSAALPASILDALGLIGYILVLPRLVEFLLALCGWRPFQVDLSDYQAAAGGNFFSKFAVALVASRGTLLRHQFHIEKTVDLL